MESNNYNESFENLEAWKVARELRKKISKLVKSLPDIEKYRLMDQLTRSSRSVTANIAEGFGRFHYLENIHHCYMARGSVMETLDHLICANDEGYIDIIVLEEYRKHIYGLMKILNGYIAYLKKQNNNNK